MTEYERKREEIARIIWSDDTGNDHGFEWLNPKHSVFKITDQILAKVEIKSDDQSLPDTHYPGGNFKFPDVAQNEMLEAGFVKVIPKKETEEKV